MERRFYLDTAIWLDVYEERNSRGEYARDFIGKIIQNGWTIYYSDMTVTELKGLNYSKKEIYNILRIAKPNLKRVHIYKSHVEEAKKVTSRLNIPRGDAIHAILARDNFAHLITRDEDFQKLRSITKPYLPEDFT